MKKLLSIAVICLTLTSCSDKLTESKVEKLVNDCIEKRPSYGTKTLRSGKLSYLSKSEVEQYEELVEKGVLTIEKNEDNRGFFSRTYYLVSFTDKAQPYIIETRESTGDSSVNTIMLYTDELDKIGGIQEIPSMNTSVVSVTFKKSNKTPFYDVLESDKTDFKNKRIELKKTENKGWIYCDE